MVDFPVNAVHLCLWILPQICPPITSDLSTYYLRSVHLLPQICPPNIEIALVLLACSGPKNKNKRLKMIKKGRNCG